VHSAENQNLCDDVSEGKGKVTDSTLKWFVTFYITNFPPQASNFVLQKNFEVCGILEEVYVADTRNRNGEVYGFVRYGKVREVDKLLKALNNVCFGQYCVRAVLGRFDRKVVREGEGVGVRKVAEERVGVKAREREKKERKGCRVDARKDKRWMGS